MAQEHPSPNAYTEVTVVSIELLGLADIPRAMQLVAAAGWNQTSDDWGRVIDFQPEGCFKAVIDDRLVGTVTTISYQRELAWIGMMLVDEAQRRQGIGSRLMQKAIEALRSQHVRSIKLDATPLGRPVYARLGFQFENDFQRWMRPASGSRGDSRTIANGVVGPLDTEAKLKFGVERYAALDRDAFGADRQHLLARVAEDSRVVCHASAFGMLRPGRVASYLGPIVADDPRAARRVINELLSRECEPVIWDVPPASSAAEIAAELNFQPVRVLTRMWLGDALAPTLPQAQFALLDPATG